MIYVFHLFNQRPIGQLNIDFLEKIYSLSTY